MSNDEKKDNVAEGTFQERYRPKGTVTNRVTASTPTFEDTPKDNENDLVHLYWLWHRGPSAIAGVTRAISICGAKSLPRTLVTLDPKEATCPKCKRLAS